MNKAQNPDGFDEEDFKPEGNVGIEGLPKKADGSFDIEAMTVEQQAQYWKHQHDQSTKGSHKLLEEKSKLEAELKLKRESEKPEPQVDEFKNFGLNEQATGVLKKTVDIAKKETINELANNPIFQQAVLAGNKARLEEAFQTLANEKGYEHIRDYKNLIINEHFNDPLSYPENILEVLKIIAGNFLWERRDEIALKNKPKHDQVDMLGGDGGDKSSNNAPVRSIAYWENMAKEDPKKFASPEMQKLFNSDISKGV